MKILNTLFLVCTYAVLFGLSGCASTPSETKKITSIANVQLSADEQNAYQNALEDIKSEHADKAIPILNKIANNHSDHIGAWINLANAYYADTKINDAELALNHAIKINPKIADIYNLQGLIAVTKGEYINAEKNYLAALQLKESYPAAHYNLALLYDTYYQDLDRAVAQYDRYLDLSDGSDKKTISWVAELKQKIKRRTKS